MAFDVRRLVLAGETTPGGGSPGGAIVEVLERVLRPYVNAIEISPTGIGPGNAAAVASGECDLGVMNTELLLAAREGTGLFATAGPADLRVVAHVNHPSWLAVAVRAELDLSDLGEIASRHLPVRLRSSAWGLTGLLLEHYGISEESLAADGGALLPLSEQRGDGGHAWAANGDFDVIVDHLHSGYAPRVRHWHDASAHYDLRFLAVPDEVARSAYKLGLGEWSTMPAWIVRGLDHDTASVGRHPYAIYGSADMPSGLARLVAQALDENRAMLRVSNVALSYDPLNVAMSFGAPLHPGAHRYYTSMRYPVGDAAEDHDHGEGADHSHGADDSSGHVHLGNAKELPSLWDRIALRGPGGTRGILVSKTGIYAGLPREDATTNAGDPDEPATPAWTGGFGRH